MLQNPAIQNRTVVVILAAGKGTRMGGDIPKVCFEIDSVPAINRTITTFKKQKFANFLIVAGTKAQQVIDTVHAVHPDVIYVYQHPQLGTGHAARIAAEALENIGSDQDVLVTMGDKFIEEDAIQTLVSGYIKQQADLALLTLPKTSHDEPPGGRVFSDKTGQGLDIVEQTDIAKQALVDEIKRMLAKSKKLTTGQINNVIQKHLPDSKKRAVAIPELVNIAESKAAVNKKEIESILDSAQYNIEINGKRYSARQIEKACKGINPSLYLFNAQAFYQGVSLIKNDNAQAEYYLTDVVKQLANLKSADGSAKFRIRTVTAPNPNCIQGFNSPDELLAIQDYIRRKKPTDRQPARIAAKPQLKKSQFATVTQWLERIDRQVPSLKRWLKKIYGPHESLYQQKSKDLKKVLKCYGKKFGCDNKVCIVRAPGRLNLMGRHVDHRGGFNNFLAIDRETIAVAGIRKDNNVIAVNTEPKKFKPVQFNISELIGRFAWSDWINFVNSSWVRNMLYNAPGDWGNYIKAAILRLQHQFQDVKINGLNLAVCGNVPIAAGLSSSSTIVVATLQAAIALNNFQLAARQFIDLCGEGEWFVGSRGGAGDHAAIYLGQRGKITNVGYLPFRVEKTTDAPKEYQLIIANSHLTAPKSSAAKDTFNARIASYNLGLALLQQRCPEIAGNIEYLRDLNPEKLACPVSQIYRFLLKVPQFMTRQDFKTMLSAEHKELIQTNFATHTDPKKYNVRGVLLFGAAEIARSRLAIEYLDRKKIQEFGRLMKISHDGDRVSRRDTDGKHKHAPQDCSDEYLQRLITYLASESPQKVLDAQLYMQPGSYACSTAQIDHMADIANSVAGVVGAQIAGAGLGGCIMIMAERKAVLAVKKSMVNEYYRPAKLKPAIIPCVVTEGAGLAEF